MTIPTIPRNLLFGNFKHRLPKLSPDGKYLAYLGTDTNDKSCYYIYVQSLFELNGASDYADDDDQPLSVAKIGSPDEIIRNFFWAGDSQTILYYVNSGGQPGDENYHLWAVNVFDGVRFYRDLTPGDNVKVQDVFLNPWKSSEIMVAINARDSSLFDMYRCNLFTGELVLDTMNPGNVIAWGVDPRTFQVQQSIIRNQTDDSTTILMRDVTSDGQFGEWKELYHYPYGELGNFMGMGIDGRSCWITSSCGRDTKALLKLDLETKETTTICEDPRCDIGEIILDPEADYVSMVSYEYEERELHFFNSDLEWHYNNLVRQGPVEKVSEVYVVGQNRDNSIWVVSYEPSNSPPIYALYYAKQQRIKRLFCAQPGLLQYPISPMQSVSIKARDGLPLVAYLSRPFQTKVSLQDTKVPAPLVLLVHGGPWEERDWYGFNPLANFLTNRGYAVLQVNFRGSSGYGKAFSHKGDGEWGVGSMQHDLTDSVAWCVENGIADKNNIAIFGTSYGGYAALSGLVFTPELYKCGIAIAAVRIYFDIALFIPNTYSTFHILYLKPSDVKSMIENVPTYWGPLRNTMLRRLGPVNEDEEFNRKISPFYHLDKMKAPLLLVQGSNDVRVPQFDTDRMVAALREKKKDVEYVVYPDEGHSILKLSNRADFFERIELFLEKHMLS